MNDAELFTDIAKTAFGDWTDFVHTFPIFFEGNPDALFRRDCPINPCAHAFLQHCAVKHLELKPAEVGKVGVVWQNLVSDLGPTGIRGRPASWLWHRGHNIPAIALDKGFVTSTIQPYNLTKILTRLVLHEIGHLVRHWRDLKPAERDPARPCDPEQEEQAWWYCAMVVGQSLGFLAKSYRLKKLNDGAWVHA